MAPRPVPEAVRLAAFAPSDPNLHNASNPISAGASGQARMGFGPPAGDNLRQPLPESAMRQVAAPALVVLAGTTDACPRMLRGCPPGPVVVYPYCPPPVYYSPPVEVVRVPEAMPAEPVTEDLAPDGWCHIRGRVVFDGDPIPKQKPIPKSGGAY